MSPSYGAVGADTSTGRDGRLNPRKVCLWCGLAETADSRGSSLIGSSRWLLAWHVVAVVLESGTRGSTFLPMIWDTPERSVAVSSDCL